MINKLKIFTFAVFISLTSLTYAQLDAPWSASGPGASIDDAGSTGTAQMSYFSPASSGAWSFSAVASKTETIQLEYTYTGFHAFFQVRVALDAFVNGSSFNLVSAGPVNCCTSPSGGFTYTGIVELTVNAGDTYGFDMSGSHGDRDRRLIGALTVEKIVVDSDGDGVLDDIDVCPATHEGAIVNAEGCTGLDVIEAACPADADYKNHGAFVSCVSNSVELAIEDGLITEEEGEEIVSAAAKSEVGKPSKSNSGKGKNK